MSNVKCKAFDYVEIYVYAYMVNVKVLFLVPMPK